MPEPPVERLGDFIVKRRLGSGGMATVYVAEQVSLGRMVALKILEPAIEDPATSGDNRWRFGQFAAIIPSCGDNMNKLVISMLALSSACGTADLDAAGGEETAKGIGGNGGSAHAGAVDRAELAREVFSDEAARAELEGWIHPRVRERIAGALAEARVAAQAVELATDDHRRIQTSLRQNRGDHRCRGRFDTREKPRGTSRRSSETTLRPRVRRSGREIRHGHGRRCRRAIAP